jgi:hypothetical protein
VLFANHDSEGYIFIEQPVFHIDGQIAEGASPEVVRLWEIQDKTLQHLWKL